MQSFSDRYIQKMICEEEAYNDGKKISDKVRNFKYFRDNGIITAVVDDTNTFEVEVEIEAGDRVRSYKCDCDDFKTCFGACKHVVAVMMYANRYFEEDRKRTAFFYNRIATEQENESEDIMDDFLPISQLGIDLGKKGQKVNLWIEQKIVLGSSYKPPCLEIELKIGIEKLYKVKNIVALVEAMDSKEPLYYGMNFTFQPDTMFFSGVEKEVMEFIKNLYFKEKIEMDFYYPGRFYLVKEVESVKSDKIDRYLLFS